MDKTLAQLAAKLMVNELMPRIKKSGANPLTPERFAIGVAAVHCGAWDTHELRMHLDEEFYGAENKG